ncbi:MAG: hypothetical protein J0I06_13070 [Planctomycetes bacterium]|nr:hypothetical protein [Planctomycetota bacterium]
MFKVHPTPEDEPVAPECRATVELIQRALDGDAPTDALDADGHASACPACRERVRAAQVLLSVLAIPAEPVALPAGFAERVLTAVAEDRRVRVRGRVYKTAARLALAAAVLVGVWFIAKPTDPAPTGDVVAVPPPNAPDVAPPPREKAPAPEPAPEPRPIRVGDALASTGQAILDVPKPLAESVAVAPKVLDALSNPFKLPAAPVTDPMATALEPARRSLADLPVAARHGLEPVTGTAEKALARFLRDVGSVKPNS